jgi:type I restriction enzyme S subunit
MLLREFDRVADAPDAVDQFRQGILALAVRGRLVPQDREDEPSAELLNGRLAQTGIYGFELPKGWCWTSLGQLGQILGGGTPSKARPEFWVGDLPWVTPKDMKRDDIGDAIDHISRAAVSASAVKLVPAGSLLMVVRGMILGRSFPTALTTATVTINQDMKALVPFDPRLRDILLIITKGLRSVFLELVDRSTHGTGRLGSHELLGCPIPMPPVDEQPRIVARVAEFMALLDELDTGQANREAQRDRLRIASFKTLATRRDPLRARFFLSNSARMITLPKHLAGVRDFILDLAVTGRLVPQDSTDEPVGAWLAAAEENFAVPAARTRRESKKAPDNLNDLVIPEGWAVASLGELAVTVTSGSRGWAQFYTSEGALFVRSQNVKYGRLLMSDRKHVSPPNGSEGTRTALAVGDLLVVVTGDVGHVGMWDRDLGEAYVSQHIALVRPRSRILSPWLLLCLMAPAAGRRQLRASVYGGKPGLNLGQVRALAVPIPPIAEQLRIRARLNELLALCDELEASLVSVRTNNSRLLEALLRKALNGVQERTRRLAS